jgi:hypothetical protein
MIDFTCSVCGAICNIAPDPPGRAVCQDHCEDHEYEYDRSVGWHVCKHCDKAAPYDWNDP